MTLELKHRALYAAFDRFPSEKGAARHIEKMAQTLFSKMAGGFLYVLGDEELPLYQKEEVGVEIFRFSEPIPNFLDRAMAYGQRLDAFLHQQADTLRICHFRDPWSGVPILRRRGRKYQTVYEVNGLPSIELPYHYPQVAKRTLDKIRATEEFCWKQADKILTPSNSLKQNLVGLGVPENKVMVIPNGAEPAAQSPPRPMEAPGRYLIYFGALQRWQGVDVLLRAFALLRDLPDLHLVLCISTHPRQSKVYHQLAEKLEIAHRLMWFHRLSEQEFAPWRAHALCSVAPLTECSRNLEQGCCPLKILESMAAGVPVIASDLPSVREILTDGSDGRLVRAERPAELARAVRILLEYPERREEMGRNARLKIERTFTWARATETLSSFYDALLVEQSRGSNKESAKEMVL